MIKTHKLALIGFGTVGQGLAEILLAKEGVLAKKAGIRFQIVAISDLLKGSLYHPEGLDIASLLEVVQRTGSLAGYPPGPGLATGWDSLSTIRDSNADTMVEISWTDVHTGQPAIDHVKAAFASGKNAVLTNKGPVALTYGELAGLARAHGVRFCFEGTVMSGTPIIRLAEQALAGCTIQEIRGILNGTTNYILTKMEQGQSYHEALVEAQRMGYAEADPTADVEGWDAAGKVVILANVIMDGRLAVEDVERTGVTGLTPADVVAAQAAGERWKLVARVYRDGDTVQASVRPTRLPLSHPLAGVSGATNACTFTTDLLGDVTLVGPGAGRQETGFAVLGDLLDIVARP